MTGTLGIMVGGPLKAFEDVKDILSSMGPAVALVGEAIVLATNAGVDPANVFEAIRKGLAGSTVLDAKMPLILQRNFKPGFRIELHIKDLVNALDTAHSLCVPILLSAQALEMMLALKAEGHAADDHGGLVQFYEQLAKVEVAAY